MTDNQRDNREVKTHRTPNFKNNLVLDWKTAKVGPALFLLCDAGLKLRRSFALFAAGLRLAVAGLGTSHLCLVSEMSRCRRNAAYVCS